jgi:hypothetical protein
MAETSTTVQAGTKLVLGPFIGDITHSSVKLWLSLGPGDGDKEVFVTLRRRAYGPQSEAEARQKPVKITIIDNPEEAKRGVIKCVGKDFGTGTVTIAGLKQNSKYSYQLWQDENCKIALDLDTRSLEDRDQKKDFLKDEDLYFWTLPEDGFWRQLDFLLMSCHHPETKKDDGHNGFAVWHQIPEIIDEEQNGNVRFAILAGDQIYADEVEAKVLKEPDPEKRRKHYFDVYKKFWDDVNYRRVLCRVPAVLMWDDHDITDGWGSREDSFKTNDSGEFKDEWSRLLETAKGMFGIMQASRNPEPLAKNFGFDTCFRVGKAGFVIADLRSNRNIRQFYETREGKKVWIGQVWLPQQLDAIKKWIDVERDKLDTLFFVSSVVFSHGAPSVEQYILRMWFWVIDIANLAGRFPIFKRPLQWFNSKVGDLRDDVNDSWGSEANQREASRALDFLFDLENPPKKANASDEGAPQYEKKPLNVVILTGDIHTPGYSTIYSSKPEHKPKAVIPHIVATPVAYEPFSWVGEAIFRHLTKVVNLGEQKPGVKSVYTSQVSHHFCYRNVVVVSLRSYEEDEAQLKVKYYLEGFPEPQVMLFDLNHGAHREGIDWPTPADNPKSFFAKLLFWRKPKTQAALSASPTPLKATPEVAEIPSTPLDLPDSPQN